jgi:hypothetical protein
LYQSGTTSHGLSGIGCWTLSAIGTDLYIGGLFSAAGGISAGNVCKYNTITSKFSALGTGANNYVFAFGVVGIDLYIGGAFSSIGGLTTNGIIKYDTISSTFSTVGQTGTGLSSGTSVRCFLLVNTDL